MKNLTLPSNLPQGETLKDKIILVTGASRGIGEAVAKYCAKEGATVILLSKTLKTLEKVYDDISEAGHPEPAIHPMNLLNIMPDDAKGMATHIEKLFGKLDGIVHCAGISGTMTPIEHYPAHIWQQVLHLNLNVPFLLTQACLPLLKKANSASVVFVGANQASGKPYYGPYACAKAGLETLKNLLTKELAENTNIRVNSLNPNKVRTKMRAKLFPGEDPFAIPEASTVAPYFGFLLSDYAKEINGESLTITN